MAGETGSMKNPNSARDATSFFLDGKSVFFSETLKKMNWFTSHKNIVLFQLCILDIIKLCEINIFYSFFKVNRLKIKL